MPEPSFENLKSGSGQEKSAEEREAGPKVDIQERSVASDNHPERNEDAMFKIPEKGVAGVFDGMGGHAAGDKAARMARTAVEQSLQKALQKELDLEQAQEAVRQALIYANAAVFNQAQVEHNDMGTTASIVYVREAPEGGEEAFVGNVGDSRVYLLRDGKLEQVTLDDSLVRQNASQAQEARRLQQKLNNTTNPQEQLTEEEFGLFGLRNVITQALGCHQTVEPRIHVVDLLPGDRLLVCSDGIPDNLTDSAPDDPDSIERILHFYRDNGEAAQRLIEAARIRSRGDHPRAKADDMTAIVIGIGEEIPVAKRESLASEKPDQEVPRLQQGAVVKVRRSSGAIEPGWVISRYDPATGDAIVIKNEGDERLRKAIPQAELERLNRPDTLQDIGSAEDLQQLFDTLRQLGGLQGGHGYYHDAELITRINNVMLGRAPLESITRTGGLRQKVKDLVERSAAGQRV